LLNSIKEWERYQVFGVMGFSLLGDELFKTFKNFELKIFDCGIFASEYKEVL